MMIKPKDHLLKIKPYQPGRPIDEVQRELGLKKVIKLASNESPFPPSPKVLKAMEKAALTVNRYPDGGCYYLREAVSERLKVPGNQLIFGNGSDELIIMALRAFVGVDDEVIIAKPSFLIYSIASRVVGACLKEIPLKGFEYDLDGMQKAVTSKTKLVFIGNPDNPAGTYISHQRMEDFIRSVPEDVLVFIDEAYFEFVTAADYAESLALLRTYPNVMVSRTFSKMYGLAGLRIGYGMASPDVLDGMSRVREPFNVNLIAQAAAVACLKDRKYYQNIARSYEDERRYYYEELQSMALSFVKTYTNFILVDVGRPATGVYEALLKRGVIVRDMTAWGMKTFLRVTIGEHKENKTFLKCLKDVLDVVPGK